MVAEEPSGIAHGSPITVEADTRLTAPGRWLRRAKIDELPQLLNILHGQMCFIGSRPETPEFVQTEDPVWKQILTWPPGLTGPSQVVVGPLERELPPAGDLYRSDVLPLKLSIDKWYLEAAGPRLDLAVLISTLLALVGQEPTLLLRRLSREQPEALVMLARLRSMFSFQRERCTTAGSGDAAGKPDPTTHYTCG